MKCHNITLMAGVLAVLVSAPGFAKKTHHPATSAAPAGLVSVSAARKAATKSVHGRVKSVKLENEEGKQQYAVMVKDAKGLHEVMVDAHTGQVASQETVTVAEEARENAAEAKASHSKATKHSKVDASMKLTPTKTHPKK